MSVDKSFYLAATQELDDKTHDPALWSKSMALNSGDEEQARYAYVNERAAELSAAAEPAPVPEAEVEPRPALAAVPTPEPARIPDPVPQSLGVDFISVADFAREKGLEETKAISMIKDGFYQGRIVDGNWYAHRSALGNAEQKAPRPPGEQPNVMNPRAMLAGELPLVWTFWLWFVVLFGVINFFAEVVFLALAQGSDNEGGLAALQFLVMLMYALPIIFGTWRAASNYEPTGIAWGTVTKVWIALTAVGGFLIGVAGV